jgi:hypothetical protein
VLLGSEGECDRDDVGIVLGGVSIREPLTVGVGQKYCKASAPVVSCHYDNAISHRSGRETGGRCPAC